jgi:hypothetical protein
MFGTWLVRDLNNGTATHAGAGAQERVRVRGHVHIDRIVTAVATGALLGALAAMPYDQLLGISGPASMILRSVLTTAVWTGLRGEQPRDLNFNAVPAEAGALGPSALPQEQADTVNPRVRGTRKWNHRRFQNVLKVRAKSILAPQGG